MNIINEIENEQARKLAEQRAVPKFGPGDTLRVNVKVVEGTRERIQAFEGVCIGRKNAGLNSAFTVRKLSYGEGVERVFPLYSTTIDSIEVVRRGAVRRAKLYYLRGRTGKRARIAEKTDWDSAKKKAVSAGAGTQEAGPEAPAEAKAEEPKPDKKAKKKKAKVEVPETGEAEVMDVAPPEETSEEAAEDKPANKAKKKKDEKGEAED